MVDSLKQRKNWKIYADRKYRLYLQKWSWSGLRNKFFKIASNPKYDWCQRRLVSIVFKFLDEKSSGRGVMSNQELAVELYKPIIRKFKRIKIYS